ncbi:hypothetical protein B0T10DRAFT_454353 [Thelonectria olida]|uniref:Uncharacterized protein n=1 Tax=Thelonectria olida TaxID=1576542 RepID=A0A9P8WH77_9HYPO|nr:hypothetical protein B0T10DRAFT_454353 [Thelonectria olida]
MWALGTPPTPPSSERSVPVPEPKERVSVPTSSMGRTDRVVALRRGAFVTRDPRMTGDGLGNGLGLFLGTFEGEMCLSVADNDAWHTREDVDAYLGREGSKDKTVVFGGLNLR